MFQKMGLIIFGAETIVSDWYPALHLPVDDEYRYLVSSVPTPSSGLVIGALR